MAAWAASGPGATFNKDVQPILQRHCQACHRPGEVGPMPLLNYQQARPWAKSIREAVLLKKMPPWFADPEHGKFSNDARLSQAEIDALVSWADAGAPEGDRKDWSKPREFVDGWNIGMPDVVLEMPTEFAVPAGGVIEYQTVILPTGFTEDKWVEALEIRPGNRAVVHHVTASTRQAGSKWLEGAAPGVPFVRSRAARQAQPQTDLDRPEYIVGYTPGRPASRFAPGQARLIKAGSDIVFSLHYTPTGTAATDRTKIGFVFAKAPPQWRAVNMVVVARDLVVPPGAAAHRVEAAVTLQQDATLIRMWPHMHVRGKYFEYRAVFPGGESRILLRVPRYDFNWQLSYNLETPLLLPKGTRIEGVAYYDNSPNNPSNPDPSAEVRWGDQSWEEMMEGYFDVAIDPRMNPADLRRAKPAPTGN